MVILIGLLLVGALTTATGYFVAVEFAYVAVDRGRLRQRAERGDPAAARALRVTARLSFVLSGAQLGITVTALMVGYVAEPYLGEGLASLLGGVGVPAAVSLAVSVVLALLVSTVIQMVLGELAPKNLAIARADALARALSRSTLLYLAVAGPVIRVFDAAANRLLRRVGVRPVEQLHAGATAEDLVQIIAEAREHGHLDPQTSALLDRGLDFRRRTAAAAMTPRVHVHLVRAGDPCTRLVDLLATGHTRFPVCGPDGVDDIIGVVAVGDLLTVAPRHRAGTPLSAVAVEPLLVPAGLALPEALDRLRTGHRQMACVVDEYGGFAGVLTLEDIAEELVGPIRDEDDLPEPGPHREEDGSWLVPARWRVDEIARATGLALPLGPGYDTLSGLIMSVLGDIPAVDQEVDLPQGVRARVLTVRRHVADTVRLWVPAGERP